MVSIVHMSNFWMSVATTNAAAKARLNARAHHVLSILVGIAIALLIGAGLFIIAVLTT
jgi:hypothetical protein